ncbi:MAG: folylpolyglutamate synthase/dihydrofolate synthase family protein [Pseudomonadota bacterium]
MAGSTELLKRFEALHPSEIDLSLERMMRVLTDLGSPQSRLPPTVHIAGTNGKGSTLAFMRAILEASGRRVHAYTSPHLVRFHERIRLAGDLIGEEALCAVLEATLKANDDAPLTFFEGTTAAALLAFSQHPADVLLLETGLGGRFDSTNVIDRPRLTVITPISFDHQEFLGETLSSIAGEKAGIFKRGVPAVIAPQPDEAMAVLERQARKVGAPVFLHGQHWQARAEHGRLVIEHEEGLEDLPLPRLPGAHQVINAGTAVAALVLAGGFSLEPQAIASGLRGAQWPARLQCLPSGLVRAIAGRDLPHEVWLDGGHNPSAGEALATMMRSLTEKDPRPLWLITAMLRNKDAAGFLSPLSGLAEGLVPLSIEGAQTHDPDQLAGIGRSLGLNVLRASTLASALASIPVEHPSRILICGSLYLAGEALASQPPT